MQQLYEIGLCTVGWPNGSKFVGSASRMALHGIRRLFVAVATSVSNSSGVTVVMCALIIAIVPSEPLFLLCPRKAIVVASETG